MDIPYSAERDDLYYPAKRAVFFPNGRPQSDAALCVEMALLAYCRQNTCFAFDQPRIRKILASIQFTDCDFFEDLKAPPTRGSHGFLALDEEKQLAVLAFRGTDKDDPTDLSDDFNAWPEKWQGGGNVHTGFADALLEIWDQVNPALRKAKGYKLLFTGHSLGAAVATLAASLQAPTSLYTFGSPRVGDTSFMNLLLGNKIDNHRYVDCSDLVARVPPKNVLGYEHFGDPYYIDWHRAIQQRAEGDPYLDQDQDDAEDDYLVRYSWRIGDVALRPLADHAPVNYVWQVTAATP